jgi:HlyD family secretion protein
MFYNVRRQTITFLLILAALGCKGRGDKNAQYKTEKVDRGTVTTTVTATGTLSAVTTVQDGSPVSGVIARLYADFNSHVKKGQLLAELDPTPFQAQVEQRQADVTKARVEAANAKINYDRQDRLARAGLAAQSDVDGTRAQYESARAQVQQSTAALSQSLTNLRYTKILSPIDGIVVDRQYDVGQTVAASFQAPTLFSIAQDLTKMQVQADVDQSDIGRIQVGQTARFTVDAYPDQEFRGRISQIRLNAQVTQNVVTYPVIIEVPNPDEKLGPKMTATVTIDVATVRNVLRIANAALRFKPATEDVAAGATATAPPAASSSTSGSAPSSAPATTDTAAAAERRERWRRNREAAGGGGGSTTGGEAGMAGFGRGRGMAGAAGVFPGGGMQREAKAQTIYTLQADKKLKPVAIRTGISDGRFTQVVSGALNPGDPVVVGTVTSKVEGPPPPGSNAGPMSPRPGGGGAGRRGM